jgi:hypothetical protein
LFNPSAALQVQGTLNKSTITVVGETIPAESGLMKLIRPVLQSDGIYHTSYEIEIEVDKPFVKEIANRGFRYIDTSDKLTPVMLSDINPNYASGGAKASENAQVSDPVNLNADGTLGAIPGDTVYLERRFNSISNWNSYLNLVRSR